MKQIKKEIKAILIFSIILIFFPVYCLAASKGKITTETVRMRKEPTTESSIITLLSQDYEVEIVEKEGDWYKVKYEEYTGYVSSEFVAVEGENEVKGSENKEEANKGETTLEINTEKQVNKQTKLYYLPLIHSEVIGIAEENEEVYIIQITGGWAYVKTDKQARMDENRKLRR